MLTLDQIRQALVDRRPSVVAKAIGVTPRTISYLRDGKTANPGYELVKALSDYLEARA